MFRQALSQSSAGPWPLRHLEVRVQPLLVKASYKQWALSPMDLVQAACATAALILRNRRCFIRWEWE